MAACTDIASSNTDCGACGVVCTGGRTCVEGACKCGGDLTACDGHVPDDDLVKRTWHLFDAIGAATGHVPLHREIRRTNDCLATIRRHKQTLVPDAFEELSALVLHWRRRDIDALQSALNRYHDRRKQLVPCIVVLLNRKARDLH